MGLLVTIYWLSFGIGLVYVLLAGALGAVGHGFAGVHGADAGGGLDHGGELGDHSGELQSADLSSADAHDGAASHGAAGHHGAAQHGAAYLDAGDSGMPQYSPLSVLSLMGTLCGFGAGGLLALTAGWGTSASLGAAAGGGVALAVLLWLVIGKLLYRMHSSSEAHVADMIGLEAEVLTPVEFEMSGEIAYVLDGTRYTAPARLIHAGRAGKADKVRIRRVGPNLVYVEEKRKLLA